MGRGTAWWTVAGAALVAIAVRLPGLGAPLAPDEAGFLLVAGQWAPGGGSLYGGYWVDRPPLLIALFALAHLFGGSVALRLLGALAAAGVVVLAALLARAVSAPDRRNAAAAWSAVAAFGFGSTPFFGAGEVDGELLAAPLVLAGVLTFVVGRSRLEARSGVVLVGVSGGLAAAAFLVKQSFLDVGVFVAAWLTAELVARRPSLDVRRTAAAFGLGAVTATALVVAAAALRGTAPGRLWDAVVVFRIQAWQVLAGSGAQLRELRLDRYPGALLVTGALAVLILVLVRVVVLARAHRLDRLTIAAAALLSWETVAALSGGSYWMHYLIGLVPSLTVSVALAVRDRGPWAAGGRVVAGWAAVSALAAAAALDLSPRHLTRPQAAGEWLAARARAGDTAVVAYGRADLLAEAGLSSPYPYLWSLPVKVLDPRLSELATVLDGSRRPVWLFVGSRLAVSNLDPVPAETALRTHYRLVSEVCGYRVYLRDGVRRPVPSSPSGCPRGAGQSRASQSSTSR